MHSHDLNKDQDQFRKEIAAILEGTSAYHRPKDKFDFVRFVFPAANFGGATFTEEADFDETVFGLRRDDAPVAAPNPSQAIANFRAARFEQPAKVRFYRVNQASSQGLRIRLTDSNVENVQFVDVRWHHHGRRMVIQDELDVTASSKPGGGQEQGQREARYELVAIAYRQLISNFEKVRAYDLAEDCSIGAMEMKRRDPAQFLFAQRLGPHYQRWNRLRWLGEHVSVVNLYRLASNYGSSYRRALMALGVLIFAFGLVFSSSEIRPNPEFKPKPPDELTTHIKALRAGFVHALGIATFRRQPLYVPTGLSGQLLEITEQILVAAQVSLLLLALRRRFRR